MRAPQWQISAVQTDLYRIAAALKQLDNDCSISDMRVGLHPIELLTHQNLPSEHIYIDLKNSENWDGPYLSGSATIQGKPYQLLKTKRGLFVVPGDGVQLPLAFIIGQDITWHAESDIAALSAPGNVLFYKSGPLTLEVVYGEKARIRSKGLLPKAVEQLGAWIAEFNQALFICTCRSP